MRKIFLIDKNNKKINKSKEIGELIYKGDNVCMGYAYNHKDLLKGDLNNKVLKALKVLGASKIVVLTKQSCNVATL